MEFWLSTTQFIYAGQNARSHFLNWSQYILKATIKLSRNQLDMLVKYMWNQRHASTFNIEDINENILKIKKKKKMGDKV